MLEEFAASLSFSMGAAWRHSKHFMQSQHLIVFPRHLTCNTCFAAVERQESAPETNPVSSCKQHLGICTYLGALVADLEQTTTNLKLSSITASHF